MFFLKKTVDRFQTCVIMNLLKFTELTPLEQFEKARRETYISLKKHEKRIMKLLNNNQEVYISIDSRNTYTVLQQVNLEE